MKKLLLLTILSLFSAQGLAGDCPDGSEPKRTVSADGSYYIYNCLENSIKRNKSTTTIPFAKTNIDESSLLCNYGDTLVLGICPNSNYPSKKKIPYGAYAYGSSWKCNSGYKKSGNSCIKEKVIPQYASKSSAPKGWSCWAHYYEKNSSCIEIPNNSYQNIPGDGFTCISGFKKSGNNCIKEILIPPNAYASGSGWKCNPGFEKQGNSCSEIQDDTIYQAGSGSGFATTKEGHILTNHHVIDGCSEVLLFKNGKSYLTTVVTQDSNNDLAILQSDYKPSKVYSLSNEVYLSDDIFAAGFPFGRKISSAITINKGIISALMGPGDDISIFQIDADINSGNSGGPIVDRRGNAVGIAVAKLNAEKAQEELKLGSTPEGFNFAVNSMMAIGLFRSQGIDLPPQNDNELSVKERNDLFNQGTFYLSCGMTIAQYEKMIKTDKVMFTRDVFFSNFESN
jgi:S1-C subfamily serine protease